MSTAALTSNILPYQRPSFALPSRTNKKWARDADTGVDFHELFESVWTNSSDALRITDSKGVIIAVNDAFCRLVGMQTEELAGKPFTITYDGSVDPSMLLAEYYTRFNQGKISPVMNKQVRLRGGKEIYAETSNSFIKGSDGGTFVLTMIRDVSERHAAEEALKKSERKYHELVNNAGQGIFQSSVDGRLITANAALIKMLGYDSFDELASHNLTEAYVNPERREALAMMLLEKGVCSNFELLLKRRDGTVITVLVHSRAVKDESGNVIMFEGILEDITERKELEMRVQDSLTALQASRESLAQLNAQKDRLFSVLSHDLRSPFTSILGFCEILLSDGETLTDAERTEFLTYIRDGAKRQLALLNRLLDWSRLQTGRIKLDIQEINLEDVVISCVETHLGTSKQKEITLRSTLPRDMKIRGDQELLMQAFNNLISNALKFTPANGVISVDLIEDKEEEWVVAVKDTGRGIPKEDIGKLFKAEEKYTRPGLNGEQGTGLGLSLVCEIVKQHNGSITVDSVLGQGTTFTIRLPRVVENKEHVVLVVDDDEGVRVLHSRFLKKMYPDAHVMQASNGKEAFALAKRYKPRIIVTDYSMPEMNGYEFLNLLKGEPATKHIPVFVITGKGSTASSDILLMSGAAVVMDKPVSGKKLQETIQKVLAEKI